MSTAPPAEPPPIILVTPTGQKITGRLPGRRQTARAWLYDVGLVLWKSTGPEGTEPAEYRQWVPAAHVKPVDGTDYSVVPTQHLRPPAPPPQWAWKVERQQHRGRAPGLLVHVYDCPTAPPGGEELNLDEALTALDRSGARACTECDAAVALSYWINSRETPDTDFGA
ncbi:DUF6233 domain-containing protein [Streptomyces sp. NPDC053474]|uniref:DUF6233 domain-containing protein n=1 Tax=Streptomyces sp. NPDC053474 TaxID=3365704 RepID=UPI0037CD54B0